MSRDFSSISINLASINDRRALWEWRSDLKHFGVDISESLSYTDYCKWYDEMLVSETQIMLIGTNANLRIGAVYFQKNIANEWQASLMVKSVYLSRQIGKIFWHAASKFFRDKYIGAEESYFCHGALANLLNYDERA